MPKRKTHNDFIKELNKINKDVHILEQYKNNHSKMKCRCKICNNEWSTTAKILLNGHGCPKCAGVNKKTNDDFLKELSDINKNILVLDTYINNRTKLKCKCLLDGFEWYSTPNSLLSGRGCPKCKSNKISKLKIKSHEEFKAQINQINPNIILLNKYVNSHTKIQCKCKKDGYEWETLPFSLLEGSNCPRCVNCEHRTNEAFLEELYNINKNIRPLTKFKKVNDKITCECIICNNIWDTTPHSLLSGKGCPKCGYEHAKMLTRKSHDKFINELYEKNKDIEIIGTYINSKTKIKCRCKLCGNIWEAIPNNLLHNSGCPVCNISIGENIIKNCLLSMKINYISQYRFYDLRGINNGVLSYDFYIPDYNLLIEYQGEQHEKANNFFGGERQLDVQLEHDKRKREYAKNHNIKLLEIWYYDFNNIEEILKSQLFKSA